MIKETTVFYDAADVGSIDPESQSGTRSISFGYPEMQLPQLFYKDGWLQSKGACGGRKSTPEDQDAIIAWRKSRVEKLLHETDKAVAFPYIDKDGVEKNREMSGPEIAQHARSRWTDAKGTWKKPKFTNFTGNRRVTAVMASELAMQLFFQDQHPNSTEPLPKIEIPCFEADVSTAEKVAILRANENDMEGRSEYTLAEKFMTVVMFVRNFLYSEAKLAHVGFQKRGERQKLHAAAQLAVLHPDLNLENRAIMPTPKDKKERVYKVGGWFDIRSFDPGECRVLLGTAGKGEEGQKQLEAMKKRAVLAMGKSDTPEDKLSLVGVPATKEQVEEYIRLTFESDAGEIPVLEKATMKTAAATSPEGSALKNLFEAYLVGNSGEFAKAKAELMVEAETIKALRAEIETLKGNLQDVTSKLTSAEKRLEKTQTHAKK